MRNDLECATQHIYKLKQIYYNNLAIFMTNLGEMMMEINEIGEEQDTINTLLCI